MYVEISPRQSGKTTRLVAAAAEFLQANPDSIIAIVSHSRGNSGEIKNKILTKLELEISWQQGMDWPDDIISRTTYNHYEGRILIKNNTTLYRGEMPPNYWFFDEFAYKRVEDVFPIYGTHNDYNIGNRLGEGNQIVANGYYCTTPSFASNRTLDILVRWCQDNNQEISFVNPWTEERLQQQYGLEPYTRNCILNDWVDYMTSRGFPIRLVKENLIYKFLKPHNFLNGK